MGRDTNIEALRSRHAAPYPAWMSIADHKHAAETDLTAAVLEILDDWQTSPAQQLRLLGLDAESGRRMMRFRNGMPLPDDPVTQRHIRALLAIASGLSHIMPHTAHAGAAWLHGPGKQFGGATPLEYMLENGLEGLERIANLISGAPHSPWE